VAFGQKNTDTKHSPPKHEEMMLLFMRVWKNALAFLKFSDVECLSNPRLATGFSSPGFAYRVGAYC